MRTVKVLYCRLAVKNIIIGRCSDYRNQAAEMNAKQN